MTGKMTARLPSMAELFGEDVMRYLLGPAVRPEPPVRLQNIIGPVDDVVQARPVSPVREAHSVRH